MKRLILYFILFLILTSCKKIVDFYIGIPLQPRFDDNNFQPGLNIFGIIRTDSTLDFNNSYIVVQKVIPAVGSKDSLEVDSVGVFVNLKFNSDSTSYQFVLTNNDSVFTQEQYRPSANFVPKAGDMFSVECYYQDLPVLYSRTIVPEKARIVDSTIMNDKSNLYFELQYDSTIYMFDIFLFSHHDFLDYQRLPAEPNTNTAVVFSSLNTTADSIVIFSYDYNLAKYYLTSNISLNFNKYREAFGTVQNGYGVFGSVNKNYFLFDK